MGTPPYMYTTDVDTQVYARVLFPSFSLASAPLPFHSWAFVLSALATSSYLRSKTKSLYMEFMIERRHLWCPLASQLLGQIETRDTKTLKTGAICVSFWFFQIQISTWEQDDLLNITWFKASKEFARRKFFAKSLDLAVSSSSVLFSSPFLSTSCPFHPFSILFNLFLAPF